MEQQYEIRNKHMLIVAGGLGVVAVFLVMWNEWRVRHENDEAMVGVLIAKKELQPGQKVKDTDVDVSKIPMRLVPQEFQGDIVKEVDKNTLIDLELNQVVDSGKIMRFSYCRGGPARQGSPLVPKEGFRVIGLKVDRDTCPPQLMPGMWVDMMYHRLDKNDTVPIMEKVLVKTINGVGAVSSAVRNIDSVGLEIRYEDAQKLETFVSVKGTRVMLWTRNPDEHPKLTGFNPELDTAGGPPPSGPVTPGRPPAASGGGAGRPPG